MLFSFLTGFIIARLLICSNKADDVSNTHDSSTTNQQETIIALDDSSIEFIQPPPAPFLLQSRPIIRTNLPALSSSQISTNDSTSCADVQPDQFTLLGSESTQLASSMSLVTAHEVGFLNVQRCNTNCFSMKRIFYHKSKSKNKY